MCSTAHNRSCFVSNHCGYPRTSVIAAEQGKGFSLASWIGTSTKREQCTALGWRGYIVRASARSGHCCKSHCSMLSPSACRPELFAYTRAGRTLLQTATPLATSTEGGESLPEMLLELGADGGRALCQARDVLLVFPTLPANPKLLPQPYCCCYYETKSTITAFFQYWLEWMSFASKGSWFVGFSK